jgi:hypothetical protein
MVRVHVLEAHAGTVQGGVRDDFDGGLVLDNGCDSVVGSSSGYSVGTGGAHSQSDDADSPTHGHAREHVPLAGIMGSSEPVEVFLNDLALLARVVDGGRGQTNANDGDTSRQGKREARDSGRGGCPRDQTGIMLPFSLKFLLVHAIALLVVFLEIKRHLAGTSLSPRGRRI